MYLKSYTLPMWELVAGEDKVKQITLRHNDGSLYDLGSSTAVMTVTDFVNREMAPALTLEQSIIENDSGVSCILNLALTASDTGELHGKYLYCVVLTDSSGNVAKLRGPMIVYDSEVNK